MDARDFLGERKPRTAAPIGLGTRFLSPRKSLALVSLAAKNCVGWGWIGYNVLSSIGVSVVLMFRSSGVLKCFNRDICRWHDALAALCQRSLSWLRGFSSFVKNKFLLKSFLEGLFFQMRSTLFVFQSSKAKRALSICFCFFSFLSLMASGHGGINAKFMFVG